MKEVQMKKRRMGMTYNYFVKERNFKKSNKNFRAASRECSIQVPVNQNPKNLH